LGTDEDSKKAFEWCKKIAEQGDAKAQFATAIFYGSDECEDSVNNKEEAFKWFEKSAKQNYAMAQLYLGKCYEYGAGVKKDEEKAIYWYDVAYTK
jgi:TPR repeat protein